MFCVTTVALTFSVILTLYVLFVIVSLFNAGELVVKLLYSVKLCRTVMPGIVLFDVGIPFERYYRTERDVVSYSCFLIRSSITFRLIPLVTVEGVVIV